MFDSDGMEGFWQEPDYLLTYLVSLMANRMGSGMGITLMVKGNVITGTLIGEREYLEQVNRVFKSIARESLEKPSKPELEAIETAFSFDEMYEDDYTDSDADGDEPDFELLPIRHLHLKDPTIIYPGSTVSFSESALPIMRIRLTTIDGWMLGRIIYVDPDDLPDMGMVH